MRRKATVDARLRTSMQSQMHDITSGLFLLNRCAPISRANTLVINIIIVIIIIMIIIIIIIIIMIIIIIIIIIISSSPSSRVHTM